MKLLLVTLLVAVGLSLGSSHASSATPDQLLQSCQAVVKAAGGAKSATVEIPAAGLACWYYMAAVQNMSVVVDQHGEHLLGVCAPEGTTLTQYVRVFAQYAQRHPEQSTDNDAALALRALVEAFPC